DVAGSQGWGDSAPVPDVANLANSVSGRQRQVTVFPARSPAIRQRVIAGVGPLRVTQPGGYQLLEKNLWGQVASERTPVVAHRGSMAPVQGGARARRASRVMRQPAESVRAGGALTCENARLYAFC